MLDRMKRYIWLGTEKGNFSSYLGESLFVFLTSKRREAGERREMRRDEERVYLGRVGEVLDTSSFMFPLCPRFLSASLSSFAVRYYKLPSLFFTTTTDTTFRKSPYQSLPKQNKQASKQSILFNLYNT